MATGDSDIAGKIGTKTSLFFVSLAGLMIFFGVVGYFTVPAPIPLQQQYPECFNEDGTDKGNCVIDKHFLQVYILHGMDYMINTTYEKFNSITNYLVSAT